MKGCEGTTEDSCALWKERERERACKQGSVGMMGHVCCWLQHLLLITATTASNKPESQAHLSSLGHYLLTAEVHE